MCGLRYCSVCMLSNFNPYERFLGVSHWSCKIMTEPGGIIQLYMRCLVTESSSIPGVTAAVMLLPFLPSIFITCIIVSIPFFITVGSSRNWDMEETLLKYATIRDMTRILNINYNMPYILSLIAASLSSTIIMLPLFLLAFALFSMILLVIGTPLLSIMTATYVLKMFVYIVKILI